MSAIEPIRPKRTSTEELLARARRIFGASESLPSVEDREKAAQEAENYLIEKDRERGSRRAPNRR